MSSWFFDPRKFSQAFMARPTTSSPRTGLKRSGSGCKWLEEGGLVEGAEGLALSEEEGLGTLAEDGLATLVEEGLDLLGEEVLLSVFMEECGLEVADEMRLVLAGEGLVTTGWWSVF